MKKLFQLNSFVIVTLTLTLLVGASACTTPPETNRNTTVTTTTTSSPAGSPQGATGNTNGMGQMGGMDHSRMQSSPGAANAPYDLQFIDTMTAHHQGALEMARIALTKAQHTELREMSQMIVRDQEREIAELRRLREQHYAGRPQAMNMEMPGMMNAMRGMDMNRLNTQTGNAFDLMFLDMMTAHHRGAVTMAQEALRRAEHPEIRQIAQNIVQAQEREIRQMNEWKAAWSRTS